MSECVSFIRLGRPSPLSPPLPQVQFRGVTMMVPNRQIIMKVGTCARLFFVRILT